MKKYFLFTPGIILVLIILLSGCKSKSPEDPCSNTGKLSFVNKMDSTIVVSIVEKHEQVTIQKDFTEHFDLEANVTYTVSISGSGYKKPDSTLLLLPCDNKLIIVKQ